MTNNIAEAYKKKEYGWLVFNIFTVLLGMKIGGIGGLLGSAIIVHGLYKTIKNNSYSNVKKTLYSLLYVVSGCIIGLIIWSTVVTLLKKDDLILTAPSSNETLQLNSTSTLNLAKEPYIDQKEKFKIYYPENWVVDSNTPDAKVNISDPKPNHIGLITVDAIPYESKYTLEQYRTTIIQNFMEADGTGNKAYMKIVSKGEMVLRGKRALITENTFAYTGENNQVYPFQGIWIFVENNGTVYSIFASSLKEHWPEYKELYTGVLSTFDFVR